MSLAPLLGISRPSRNAGELFAQAMQHGRIAARGTMLSLAMIDIEVHFDKAFAHDDDTPSLDDYVRTQRLGRS